GESPEYFIALEYVDGENAASLVKKLAERGRTLPPRLALYIAVEAAKALAYAHGSKGQAGEPLELVHSDISPHNLLVAYRGEVKVTDFGIARVGEGLPQSDGVLRGKVSYFSPEQ